MLCILCCKIYDKRLQKEGKSLNIIILLDVSFLKSSDSSRLDKQAAVGLDFQAVITFFKLKKNIFRKSEEIQLSNPYSFSAIIKIIDGEGGGNLPPSPPPPPALDIDFLGM